VESLESFSFFVIKKIVSRCENGIFPAFDCALSSVHIVDEITEAQAGKNYFKLILIFLRLRFRAKDICLKSNRTGKKERKMLSKFVQP